MRLLAAARATAGSCAAVAAADTASAQPLAPGLHNLTTPHNFYVRPGVLYAGRLAATDLFEVTRISASGRWAEGHPNGERSTKRWIPVSVLSRRSARAPRETKEVAGPAGTRVFRSAAALACRETNFLTVGIRLRGARSGRVIVLRGGTVVERSLTLAGTGLAVDQIHVPCDGKAIVRYIVDGRQKDFRVTVDAGAPR